MKTQITFEDGYVVIWDGKFPNCITVKMGDKIQRLTVSDCKEIHPSHPMSEKLRKVGKNPADYATDGNYVIRLANGVRELISSAKGVVREQQREMDEKFYQEMEQKKHSALEKCTLRDPVQVTVRFFDGYPSSVEHCGRSFNRVDWSKVEQVDGIDFIERSALSGAEAHFNKRLAEKAAVVAAAKKEFNDKLEEAKRTGKPVAFRSFMTTKCMNGSSDCSFDHAVEMVRPDGSTYTNYTCCY